MRTGFGANFYMRLERVEQDKPIPPSALQSLDEGKTLFPLMSPMTVGDKPSSFSKDRSFWVPAQISRYSDKSLETLRSMLALDEAAPLPTA